MNSSDLAFCLADKLVKRFELSRCQAEQVATYVIDDSKIRKPSLTYTELCQVCIAAALRKGREDLDWTQEEARTHLGIGLSTIKHYEIGEIPPPKRSDTLKRLLQGYRLDGDLYDGLLKIAEHL